MCDENVIFRHCYFTFLKDFFDTFWISSKTLFFGDKYHWTLETFTVLFNFCCYQGIITLQFWTLCINSMDELELKEIKEKVDPYLDKVLSHQGLNMVFFMLTNIMEESTELLCAGQNARALIRDAYDIPEDAEQIILKGVVSRKKQLLPVFVETLQQ